MQYKLHTCTPWFAQSWVPMCGGTHTNIENIFNLKTIFCFCHHACYFLWFVHLRKVYLRMTIKIFPRSQTTCTQTHNALKNVLWKFQLLLAEYLPKVFTEITNCILVLWILFFHIFFWTQLRFLCPETQVAMWSWQWCTAYIIGKQGLVRCFSIRKTWIGVVCYAQFAYQCSSLLNRFSVHD